jgi:hypothetical protein
MRFGRCGAKGVVMTGSMFPKHDCAPSRAAPYGRLFWAGVDLPVVQDEPAKGKLLPPKIVQLNVAVFGRFKRPV